MDTQSILTQLKAERKKIDTAIQALELLGDVSANASRLAQVGKKTPTQALVFKQTQPECVYW